MAIDKTKPLKLEMTMSEGADICAAILVTIGGMKAQGTPDDNPTLKHLDNTGRYVHEQMQEQSRDLSADY